MGVRPRRVVSGRRPIEQFNAPPGATRLARTPSGRFPLAFQNFRDLSNEQESPVQAARVWVDDLHRDPRALRIGQNNVPSTACLTMAS
jgi:hypothetical protein